MSTKEEMMNYKPPEDVVVELNQFAEVAKKEMPIIKAAFYDIFTQPFLDGFIDLEERARQASKVLMAQVLNKVYVGGNIIDMEFRVIDKSGIKFIPKLVDKEDEITHEIIKVEENLALANVYGIFAGSGDNNAAYTSKFGVLTLWGSATEMITVLERDCDYKAPLNVKQNGNITTYELTLNDMVEVEHIKLNLPPIKDMIINYFEPFPVSQVGYNIGDRKLLKGMIKSTSEKPNTKGKNMGRVVVVDGTTKVGDFKNKVKDSEATIMFSATPEFASRYGIGSECYFLVDIKENKEGKYAGGHSIWGHLIIPIVAIPTSFGNFLNTGVPAVGSGAGLASGMATQASQKVPSPAAMGKW